MGQVELASGVRGLFQVAQQLLDLRRLAEVEAGRSGEAYCLAFQHMPHGRFVRPDGGGGELRRCNEKCLEAREHLRVNRLVRDDRGHAVCKPPLRIGVRRLVVNLQRPAIRSSCCRRRRWIGAAFAEHLVPHVLAAAGVHQVRHHVAYGVRFPLQPELGVGSAIDDQLDFQLRQTVVEQDIDERTRGAAARARGRNLAAVPVTFLALRQQHADTIADCAGRLGLRLLRPALGQRGHD